MVVMLVGDDAEEERGEEQAEAVASHTRLEVVTISTLLLIVSFLFPRGSADDFTVSSFFRRASAALLVALTLEGEGDGAGEEGKERFLAWRVGEGGSVSEKCVVLDMDHLRFEHTVGVARTALTNLNVNIRLVLKKK